LKALNERERKKEEEKEMTSLEEEANELVKEKGWLKASALFFMQAQAAENGDLNRLNGIAELFRAHIISSNFTDEEFERFEQEVDLMQLPDPSIVYDWK
jgi:hypothetical protein